MGYGEVGGNGSVEWAIEADNPKWVQSQPKVPKGHRQSGSDSDGAVGAMFQVRLEIPRGSGPRAAFIQSLSAALAEAQQATSNRVTIELPIEEKNRDQIQIEWPSS